MEINLEEETENDWLCECDGEACVNEFALEIIKKKKKEEKILKVKI